MLFIFAAAIAVVLGALYYGLNSYSGRTLGLAGTYGECTVSDGVPVQFRFSCPNQAALTAALDEFAKRNPGHKLETISVTFKQ